MTYGFTESLLSGNDAATVAKDTLVGGVAGGLLAGAAYGIEKGAAAIGNAIKGKNTPPPKPDPVRCTHEGACFVVGTKVLTSFGLKAIEKIRPGDKVLATDPETGRQEEKEVVRTFVKETDTLVHLRIGGEEIVTTESHPFYVDGEGWVTAGELTEEDCVLDSEGRRLQVEEKYVENLEESVKVYNFEVEEFHTYYVGDAGILVHNKCWEDPPSKATGNATRKEPPNKYGRKGGIPHQQTVKNAKTNALVENPNAEAMTEHQFHIQEGKKDSRFADVVITENNKIKEVHQVGKTLQKGNKPVKREREAFEDIFKSTQYEKNKDMKVYFHDYEKGGKLRVKKVGEEIIYEKVE